MFFTHTLIHTTYHVTVQQSTSTSDLDESFDDVNAIVQQWKQSAEAGHSSGSGKLQRSTLE